MHPGRQLAALAERKENLRAQIRLRRQACTSALAALLGPVFWIDWGVRLLRFIRSTRRRAGAAREPRGHDRAGAG